MSERTPNRVAFKVTMTVEVDLVGYAHRAATRDGGHLAEYTPTPQELADARTAAREALYDTMAFALDQPDWHGLGTGTALTIDKGREAAW